MTALPDRFGRPLRNLRLSVTDRCNLRCQYCQVGADAPEKVLHLHGRTTVFVIEGVDVRHEGEVYDLACRPFVSTGADSEPTP